MPTGNDYSILIDLYHTIVRYLSRSLVQRQLLAILLVVLGAGLLSALLVDWGERRYVRWCWNHRRRLHDRRGRRTLTYRLVRVVAIVLQQVTFPLLAIALLAVTDAIFANLGWLRGLLTLAAALLTLFTCYRLLIALLYIVAHRRRAGRYQRRLFGPLLFVFILLLILSQLTDLELLA